MSLQEIIISKIAQDGPMAFRDFMDMCLYFPDLGYYVSERQKIGEEGDFYTSCHLTSSFGAVIAKQLEEMWQLLDKPSVFTIVEYGAGSGFLCHDILQTLNNNPELYNGLRYCIIEKSPFIKYKQTSDEKLYCFDSIEDINDNIDCIVSNELLDNFPVHQVVMEDHLMEVFIDYKDGFREVVQPAGDKLISYFEAMDVSLPKGYRTEVNLDAINWLQQIAGRLGKGFIITIDYGDLSENLYKPYRCCGTLVSYNKHNVSADIYANIGEQDITAHVNFSALQHWGEKTGLSTCGITLQAYFLLSLGFREHLEKSILQQGKDFLQAAKEIAFINHTLLFDMGSRYKVLIQSKGMPEAVLSGLRLSHCQSL